MRGVLVAYCLNLIVRSLSWISRSRSTPVCARFAYPLVFVPALAALLSACAMEGDFGRPQPTFFKKFTDQYIASDTTLLGTRGGSGVTDDEMAMRNAGNLLSSPLILPEPTMASRGWKDSGYGTDLPPASPELRLEAIDRQLRADHQALTDFGESSRRVLITDSRRMQAVYDHNPYLLEQDRQTARARMRENYDYVIATLKEFATRLQAYHQALQELQDTSPNVPVVEAENTLYHLRDRASSLEYELQNLHGVTLARGQYRPHRPPRRWDAGYERNRLDPTVGDFERYHGQEKWPDPSYK
ncbi:MAG: hypothetical protein MPJ78_09470 [Hyphomicrobiaceae bacterium]|nr:hypothetical protein [Hyphomicrobiaceae bacterium]